VIDIAIDRTDLVQHTHRFANITSNTNAYCAYASLLRKGAATNLPLNFTVGAAPLPATVVTYSSGSFADKHMFGASVGLDSDSDSDRNTDASIGMTRCQRNASGQRFDFSLTPLVPDNLTSMRAQLAGRLSPGQVSIPGQLCKCLRSAVVPIRRRGSHFITPCR
jgi:hypothetical protein